MKTTLITTFTSITLALITNGAFAQQHKIIYAGSLLASEDQKVKTEQTLVITDNTITAIKNGYLTRQNLTYLMPILSILKINL